MENLNVPNGVLRPSYALTQQVFGPRFVLHADTIAKNIVCHKRILQLWIHTPALNFCQPGSALSSFIVDLSVNSGNVSNILLVTIASVAHQSAVVSVAASILPLSLAPWPRHCHSLRQPLSLSLPWLRPLQARCLYTQVVYLSQGDDGIFGLDWSSGSNEFPYLISPLEAIQARSRQDRSIVSWSLDTADTMISRDVAVCYTRAPPYFYNHWPIS